MKITDLMQEKDIDSILITSMANMTYLAGFKPPSSSVLIIKDEPILFTSKMDIANASLNSKIPVEEFKSFNEIKKNLKGTVGVENSISFGIYKKICDDFEVKSTDIIEKLRLVKTSDEVKNIEHAIKIAETSFKDTEIRGKECEVAAEIEHNMRINGSSKPAFDTIVASGVRSSFPHSDPSTEVLKSPTVIDWGAVYNNYCSDTTRTIIETEKQEEIFDIVLQAQKEAISVIKPGIKASYIDKVARDVIVDYGYGESFIHSTGHGVGLEVHESPSLAKREKLKIEKGMVITIEPGIYLKGEFGVRIEDMVHVKNKANVLTKIKKKI